MRNLKFQEGDRVRIINVDGCWITNRQDLVGMDATIEEVFEGDAVDELCYYILYSLDGQYIGFWFGESNVEAIPKTKTQKAATIAANTLLILIALVVLLCLFCGGKNCTPPANNRLPDTLGLPYDTLSNIPGRQVAKQ